MISETSTPGIILPGGIVLVDEPATLHLSVFHDYARISMVFTCRDGGTCSQMIIGLSANQTVQLFDWMGAHVDTCRSAIAEGNGGVQFSEVRGNHEHLRVVCGRPLGFKRGSENSDERIDCDHVFGLLTRHHVRWPRWGPRSSPKQSGGLEGRDSKRVL